MRITSLASTAAPTQPNAEHAKLRKAAGEFEAAFAKELLRPMEEETSGSDGGSEGEDASGAGGSLRSYATEALAMAIGAHGGLGLAHAVLQRLEPSTNANPPRQ